MSITLWIIASLLVLGVLMYQRASLLLTSAALVGLFAVGQWAGIVGPVLWVLLALVLIPLNLAPLRTSLLTKPLLKMYRSVMPEMSTTEKDAIDAGTVWWEGELFRGAPDWKKLHSIKKSELSAEEQAFLDGPVEEVCKMCNDWEITHSLADMPPEMWQYLKDNKFFAMIIKKEYGGLEFSAYAQSRVLQKLAGVSTVLASTVGVPNSLGPGELLQHYGTDEQKNYYLPRLAKGEEVPCFALTSPEAGSDAGAIPDTGVVCKGEWEGKEIVGIKLNFNKRYITLAPVATVIGLAFKLNDPDGLLGDTKELGITAALIPRDTKGMEIGRRHFPLNVPFMNGPIRGEDVFVPLDFIIGGEKMAGKGWRMLVECLSVGRAITLPSNSAGGIKSIALATGAYSRIRRQFKLPIGKMEGVEEAMARIGGNAYLMDAVTSLSTTGIDLGEKPSVISAIAKYHMTEKLRQCMDDAMDIHGGKGICLGPNNYLGRGYQGVPVAITVEGANILTRSMMIYGQGAIRCHPYVLEEMEASADHSAAGLKRFDKAIFGHIGFAMSNFVRSLFLGLGGHRLSASPYSDSTKVYYQQMNRFSSNLALLSDVAMGVLGGSLKRKERISARLGDMLSYLYLASATLKRFEDEGRLKEDLSLLRWGVEDSLYKLQESQLALLDNFGGVGKVMKVIMYPFGRIAKQPSDKTDHKVARMLMQPNETRSRLGAGQFVAPEGQFGFLEQTLVDIIAAEPLYDRVCKAAKQRLPFTQLHKVAAKGKELGVLSDDEVALLERAEQGRLKVINVDDFDHAELMAGEAARNYQKKAKTSEAA
ncbi:acyl-CoA dehydrogenase [Pseudidiomarina planktonica]|uniref:Acyl-coenzyme A dehydrogenase n=1 Tax=Pseudidiomarina planktonica TaxID=1323738 RepID=A0A1Y6EVE0_9GAMM|nr:acyl-CoA dehydrogenase FadE [Pseudidiomarina planktonica]RUO65093.1 acyl-CoA dehydrogenase [Pseudidiomarina planktonica]SMQ66517.1 acyl-CoA dehydrogenase [Pseudidiomarina planktonica]